MHNRARMITASFLVKQLLVNWRIGEAWFMKQLIDGDLASNRGNWRWVAGVGVEASPFFRIFNPVAQGQRFDPDGLFVRRWLPSLSSVPVRLIHEPWRMTDDQQRDARVRIGLDYPAPIVDLRDARERALRAYAEARRAK